MVENSELKHEIQKARMRVARREKYHQEEKLTRASTATGRTTFIYRCPLCKFNVQGLKQFGNHGLRVQERIYGGRGKIRVEDAPITEEYREAVKRAIIELSSNPPE